MHASDKAFRAELVALLGPEGMRDETRMDEIDPGFHADNLAAGLVALPRSTPEAQAIVGLCARHGIAMVAQGGRTGLAGGAASTPGQLIVSTARLDGIEPIDALESIAVVGAGVRLAAVEEMAGAHGLTLGIDLAARDTATIGGMISTNAGGTEAFRNGMMRTRVLGLEAVLADGSVVSDMSRVTKVNEGLDVKQLFIGAEGTLGIVTRAVLRLVPRPGERATALTAVASATAAVRLFHRLRQAASGGRLVAAEIMFADYVHIAAADLKLERLVDFCPAPAYVLIELSAPDAVAARADLEAGLAAAMAAGEGLLDALVAQSEAERAQFWRLREDTWAVERQKPGGLWFDISLPLALIDTYMTALRARLAAIDPALGLYVMGHLGDGNLHVTVATGEPLKGMKDEISRAVEHDLKAAGGAISAEHGIGLDKRLSLHRESDAGKLALMRAIKAALDPHNLMNPGKIY
jgi:FAD/FMN-containing dehydrogenase